MNKSITSISETNKADAQPTKKEKVKVRDESVDEGYQSNASAGKSPTKFKPQDLVISSDIYLGEDKLEFSRLEDPEENLRYALKHGLTHN